MSSSIYVSIALQLSLVLSAKLLTSQRAILLPVSSSAFRSELEYEALEALERKLQTRKDASGGCYATEGRTARGKQTLDSVVAELWKLKAQPAELKPGLNPELDTRKLIVLDASVAAHVFVGACVLIGVVVAGKWK